MPSALSPSVQLMHTQMWTPPLTHTHTHSHQWLLKSVPFILNVITCTQQQLKYTKSGHFNSTCHGKFIKNKRIITLKHILHYLIHYWVKWAKSSRLSFCAEIVVKGGCSDGKVYHCKFMIRLLYFSARGKLALSSLLNALDSSGTPVGCVRSDAQTQASH